MSSGLAGPTFDPHSPQAAAIAELFTRTLIVCAVIFLVVVGLVTFCLVRFRSRPGRVASQTEGNARLELGWTLVPLAIVGGLLLLTSRAMAISDPDVDRPADLTIIAHQWWWEARYASGALTANEIHLPVGKPLVLRIESADVVHDFWVPSLGRKIDAIPGRPVNVTLQADAAGVYEGTCAEFCGMQHAWMRIRVVAEAPEQFAAWEQHALQPATAPVDAVALAGAHVFASKTCIGCHAVRGFSDAHVAPDLTHVAERATLGAGVIENTPLLLAAWLKNPQQLKPGCNMPNGQLSDTDVTQLVAYLETLR